MSFVYAIIIVIAVFSYCFGMFWHVACEELQHIVDKKSTKFNYVFPVLRSFVWPLYFVKFFVRLALDK